MPLYYRDLKCLEKSGNTGVVPSDRKIQYIAVKQTTARIRIDVIKDRTWMIINGESMTLDLSQLIFYTETELLESYYLG